jgi:hypothetical protein
VLSLSREAADFAVRDAAMDLSQNPVKRLRAVTDERMTGIEVLRFAAMQSGFCIAIIKKGS